MTDAALADLMAEAWPDVPEKIKIAEAAEEAATQRRQTADTLSAAMPDTADGVADWLAGAAKRRTADVKREAEIAALTDLQTRLEDDIRDRLTGDGVDDLLQLLSSRFEQVWGQAVAVVQAMDETAGFEVNSIEAAVRGGCSDDWKALWELAPEIDEVRRLQTAVYRLTNFFDDNMLHRAALGDGRRRPDERIYFFRALDAVTPGWGEDEKVPWPDDAAARIVWCIRSGAGAWVPTAEQLRERLATPDPETVPDLFRYNAIRGEAPSFMNADPLNGRFDPTPSSDEPEDMLRHVRESPNATVQPAKQRYRAGVGLHNRQRDGFASGLAVDYSAPRTSVAETDSVLSSRYDSLTRERRRPSAFSAKVQSAPAAAAEDD
ncbi:hypothetical protein [Mycolicibacterium grossiae]|uniref:Uncharacterized protein n=1 Tax=Mycolicibacterium grossiae TaxID=1552759 RepID=A0A1E8QBJ6_9MYCO|nr:hypothetical protein [Mycolicibacterium grossiae]OFJ55309.1 hypothetical protein BEL07_02545 [Mycolicibacterium grossiae]QEM46304.1 hypothetical protein FZ046_17375 [Mycolicibacterium grossiae]